MSRSGYSDECDGWQLICWRGAVNSAIKGKRGQAFLRELAAAMDAMPEKKLIKYELENQGQYCTLGVVGHARGLNMENLDPEEAEEVSDVFGIAQAMTREIVYMNDDLGNYGEPPEERWSRMRRWVERQIIKEDAA